MAFFWHSDFTKFNFGRGSAQDPAGGAYDALPNPLVDWREGYSSPLLHWRCPLNPISESAPDSKGESGGRVLGEAAATPMRWKSEAPVCCSCATVVIGFMQTAVGRLGAQRYS